MKQKKISNWLKGLVVLLGVLGILFFGGLTGLACYLKDEGTTGMLWGFIFFSWYTAILCYGVLFQFWKVCNQIGADNSFSLENAVAFHKMGLLGAASAVGYLLRLLYHIIIGQTNAVVIVYSIVLMLLSSVFIILCESLSQLIRNAYEVKMENELTI